MDPLYIFEEVTSAIFLYDPQGFGHATHYQQKAARDLSKGNNIVQVGKMVTQSINVKLNVVEKDILELAEYPRSIKKTQKLLQDKEKDINHLKKKLGIPRPHPAVTKELDALEKEKEVLAQKMVEAEDKIFMYVNQVSYLQGRLLTTSDIAATPPSMTEQLASKEKSQSSEKEEIVCLQAKLTKRDLDFSTLERENIRLEGTVQEKVVKISTLEQEVTQL